MRPNPSLIGPLAVALAASLLSPSVALPLGLAILVLVLSRFGPLSKASRWITLGAALLVALLGVEVLVRVGGSGPETLRSSIAKGYEETWSALDELAASTIERLEQAPISVENLLPVFEVLAEEAAGESPVPTLHLLDERGAVVAWGGKGLLHGVEDLVARGVGHQHQASFSAVTLVAVDRLVIGGRPWHLAAGQSLRTEAFPFADLGGRTAEWTVVPAGTEVDPGMDEFGNNGGPVLVVAGLDATPERFGGSVAKSLRLGAVCVWALVLLVQGWLWRAAPWVAAALTTATGLFLLGIVAEAPVWITGLLAVGGFAVTTALCRGSRRGPATVSVLLGVAAALSAFAIGRLQYGHADLPDLGSQLWSSPQALAGRVALALLAWGFLALAPAAGDGTRERRSPGVLLALSLLALAMATILLDHAWIAVGCLALAGVAIALWKRDPSLAESTAVWAIPAVLAILLAATGWEIAYRWGQQLDVRDRLLPAMAPPESVEIEALADEMEAFLEIWDLQDLVPAGLESHSQQDLAFEIWRRSPLSRFGGLSALRVQLHSGSLTSFSFGLPLNAESWVDWTSPLFGSVPVSAWQDAVLVGDGRLSNAGEPWAYAEYALALQPGFRLRQRYEGDLAEVLLRAGPEAGTVSVEDLGGAVYGLFDDQGQPIVSTWSQPPKLSAAILAGGDGPVITPDGPATAFSAVGADGVRVLFLPDVSWSQALERVGSHALPTVLLLAALVLALRIPQWLRHGIRSSWFHLWHSYSRRLVLVYSILLLLPLGVINFLVVRAFEERLVREQEAAGLLAVESAQGVLGEYVRALEPGFGIDAALDDELLHWLSGVLHSDVNLYWRGLVYASSKAELFTAGLLPRRIPGEIYSGLTLLGHRVSMRTNQAGRAEYLELYAPLTVPGVAFGQARLIVSLPLLAQQEETAAQIASLRRRTLLGTAAVVLVIMGLGFRLARRFTAPITDIVAGTERIAAGDVSLRLQPAELELATLVEAIDDMAARIHAARQELLREKRVVDRMVENITSGVVSLDDQGRVVMVNRVAEAMVGARFGEDLLQVVRESERLAPLADFVIEMSGGELAQRTVGLRDSEGEEHEWTLVWVPLPGVGEPSALLVLEDVTEVLQGQRLQAWAEMARMIAHEIKNPLTPIRLSAEHMQEVYESDPQGFAEVFESCTANILTQVGELQEIASEFSTYSRIPKIEPQPGNLVDMAEGIVAAYRPTNDIRVELRADRARVDATFDAKLLGRAVRNLVENAQRVTARGGRVEVAISQEGDTARITVSDHGPGVEEGLLARIFDPYFSTHDSGTGLGLPIAKRIAEEHGGEIVARNRDSGGLEVTIRLPAD